MNTTLQPTKAPHHSRPLRPSGEQHGRIRHPVVLQQGPRQRHSIYNTVNEEQYAEGLSSYLPACVPNPSFMPEGVPTNEWRT